ncbi:hypothetical protein S245_067232 [Arachis hypogaea]
MQKSQKSLRFDLVSTVQVTLISSTPLSLLVFAATLTPASPPIRHFPSSFSASRPIHHLSSKFAARCCRFPSCTSGSATTHRISCSRISRIYPQIRLISELITFSFLDFYFHV